MHSSPSWLRPLISNPRASTGVLDQAFAFLPALPGIASGQLHGLLGQGVKFSTGLTSSGPSGGSSSGGGGIALVRPTSSQDVKGMLPSSSKAYQRLHNQLQPHHCLTASSVPGDGHSSSYSSLAASGGCYVRVKSPTEQPQLQHSAASPRPWPFDVITSVQQAEQALLLTSCAATNADLCQSINSSLHSPAAFPPTFNTSISSQLQSTLVGMSQFQRAASAAPGNEIQQNSACWSAPGLQHGSPTASALTSKLTSQPAVDWSRHHAPSDQRKGLPRLQASNDVMLEALFAAVRCSGPAKATADDAAASALSPPAAPTATPLGAPGTAVIPLPLGAAATRAAQLPVPPVAALLDALHRSTPSDVGLAALQLYTQQLPPHKMSSSHHHASMVNTSDCTSILHLLNFLHQDGSCHDPAPNRPSIEDSAVGGSGSRTIHPVIQQDSGSNSNGGLIRPTVQDIDGLQGNGAGSIQDGLQRRPTVLYAIGIMKWRRMKMKKHKIRKRRRAGRHKKRRMRGGEKK